MKKRFLICFVCLVCLLTMSAFAAAPVILSQPQNYYFPADTTFPAQAVFSVLAQGDGELSYHWQTSFDGGEWVDRPSTTNTLTTTVTDSGVNGVRLFRCIISNSSGSVVTQAVTVEVGSYVMDSIPQLLSYVTDTGNAIFDWVGQACTKIVSEPLLLFTVGFLALGGAIGIVGRLLSRS